VIYKRLRDFRTRKKARQNAHNEQKRETGDVRAAASAMWSPPIDIFMKGVVKQLAKIFVRSSPIRHVAARLHMAPWLFVPPGYFYSPIPALGRETRRTADLSTRHPT
jgi:hypothetical protein